MVEGPKHLSGAGLVHGTVEVATEFEAVRVPLDRGQADGSAQAVVTLFNASTELNRATVTVVSAVTGQTLDEVTRSLKPREVLSLRLSPPRLAHSLDRPTVEEARVRVSAQAPGLLVAGRSVLAAGETIDHSFFPAGDAHAAGSYPVLPLEEFDVDLTLANLDPEDSQVVAQFFWDGGTYAFGPVTIPGGTSYRLSVADVVQRADPDVLGRTLPGQLPGGFLKWKVMSGSRRLLGRTEARYRDSSDAFGFNCFGCCYEVPFGTIVPDFVDFEPGQSPLFEASMGYDTCSGTMGPYPFIPGSLTVPSPFSWDAVHISASSASQGDLSFLEWEEEYFPDCSFLERPVRAFGIGSACKAFLKKAHNPTQFWSNSQACTLQDADCNRCKQCCSAQKNYRLCRKKNPDIVESEFQACFYECEIDHCV